MLQAIKNEARRQRAINSILSHSDFNSEDTKSKLNKMSDTELQAVWDEFQIAYAGNYTKC